MCTKYATNVIMAATHAAPIKLSPSLFEQKTNRVTNDDIFASCAAPMPMLPKTPRQTASDRKWEGIAWISPEQLARNVDKRPRRAGAVDVSSSSGVAVSERVYPKPRPADPVTEKDMEQRRRDKDRIPSEMTYAWDDDIEDWKMVPRPYAMQIGMFFAYNPIPTKQMVLLEWLVTDNETSALSADFLRTHLIPRLNRTHPVSLRLLDWLVVDYAREKGIAYRRWFPHIKQYRLVVVYSLYFEWLTRWRRRHYDVFRRRHRIYFKLDGQTYSTTVAQLHFFYMAELYGFLDFAQENAKDIETHMQMKLGITNDIKKKAAESGETYRRRPLVEKCPPKAYISEGDCTLTFKMYSSSEEDDNEEEDEDDGDE